MREVIQLMLNDPSVSYIASMQLAKLLKKYKDIDASELQQLANNLLEAYPQLIS